MKAHNSKKPSKKITVTVGDLIAAAYEVARGKTEGARRLLTKSPLGEIVVPHVRFV